MSGNKAQLSAHQNRSKGGPTLGHKLADIFAEIARSTTAPLL